MIQDVEIAKPSRKVTPMRRMTFWNQLSALLWRNYLLKKTEKAKTFWEIIMPLLMVASLMSIKSGLKPSSKPAHVNPVGHVRLITPSHLSQITSELMAAPRNPQVESVMHSVVEFLNTNTYTSGFNYSLHNSSEAMEDVYRKNITHSRVGIVFSDNITQNGSYIIRFPLKALPSPNIRTVGIDACRAKYFIYSSDPTLCPGASYYSSGFSVLQAAIDASLIKLWTNNDDFSLTELVVKILPKPAYVDPGTTWRSLVPLYMTLAFSPFVSVLCVNIVLEKERKIKEGMLMMGMMPSAYWIAWFLIEAIIVFAVSSVMTVMVYVLKILPNTDTPIIFIISTLYGFTIVMFSFMATPFFNKSKVAGSVVGLLMLFFSFFYMLAVFLKGRVGAGVFYLVSLLSPAAFSLGLEQISEMDVKGAMKYQDITTGSFSVASSLVMLVIDTFLYGFLAYYFDSIIPGEYGQRRKPWFIFDFLTRYFLGKSPKPSMASAAGPSGDAFSGNSDANPDVEEVPAELNGKEAVRITGIKKVFSEWRKDPVVAVDGISLTMYESQISALLGHNGAGKSTLINMLVGTLAPTEGTAFLYNYDVTKLEDVQKMRKMTGVCLQQDILFDTLTARQHLTFFARMKGIPRYCVKAEVEKILADLDMTDRAEVQASKLSGGQKRKLSVAIALIGDPKIVFLDEPSSGMDPYSRRHLWTELQKRKEGKVIVLTTHFMDEADILADWKAIICKGKLRCAGTSLFLKNRFGIGYHLTTVVDPSYDKTAVTKLIQHYVPNTTISRSTSSELSFILPMDSTYSFSNLFSAIEKSINEDMTGIKSYGVSMTTLEEVFLKMGEVENDEDLRLADLQTQFQKEIDEVELVKPSNESTMPVTTAKPRMFQSFWAFFKVRLLLFIRTPMHVVPLIVLPAMMISLSFTFLSQSEVPTSGFITLDPVLYSDARSIQGFKGSSVVDQDLEIMEKAYATQNLTVQWKNGSVILNVLSPNSHYGIVIDRMTTDTKKMQAVMTMLFNDSFVHTLPILQSATFNSFYAIMMKSEEVLHSRQLQVSSHPWPQSNLEKTFDSSLYTWIMMMSVVLAYMPPLITVEVVEDRQNKVKNLLRVSGLLFGGYWHTVLLSHAVLFLMSVLMIILALVALRVPFLTDPMAILAMVILFVLYVPASLLVCYCLTHMFNKHETAKGVLPFMSLLSSMFPSVPVTILDMLGSSSYATALHYILCLLLPFYIPNGGLYYITKTSVIIETRLLNGFPADRTLYFAWESNILFTYIASGLHIIVYYFVLRMADIAKAGGRVADAFWITRRIIDITPNSDIPEKEDDDVKSERRRVAEMDISLLPKPPVVYVHELRKVYEEGSRCRGRLCIKVAVRNMSMAINTGDIFGLLGPNGAGKTSAIKVIIGEESASSGRVAVGGYEITSNLCEAFKMLGYCPQHDALWNNLTLKEHLTLFASLRGIRRSEISGVTTWLMEKLNITEHADKKAKNLSGGTKRKLSYAISMLGQPRIVLLDEPSTGMDPQSKRFLWDTICSTFPHGGDRGALLTTHSMEEADVLCTRVGIMVRGALRCLGSTQHLKNKYGAGYTLDIKMQRQEMDWEENLNDLKAYIHKVFPSAILREGFQDRLTYSIPQSAVSSLAAVFSAMDDAKPRFRIEEFSFSQTTLEQVFLGFAKEQELDFEEAEPNIQA